MTTDKTLLRNRFSNRFKTYNKFAVVQQEICEQLAEMMQRNHPFPVAEALEVGAGTGFLTRRLLEIYPDAHWTINDLAEDCYKYIQPYAAGKNVDYQWGDAELLDFDGELELIASASTVQWFEDFSKFLSKVYYLLKGNGMLAVSTFGPENFKEIKQTTGEGLIYYSAYEIQQLLKDNGIDVIEILEYTKKLHFDSPTEVLRHIKATGVNSIRPVSWTKQSLQAFEERYTEYFREPDSTVSLTYHPFLIIGRRL